MHGALYSIQISEKPELLLSSLSSQKCPLHTFSTNVECLQRFLKCLLWLGFQLLMKQGNPLLLQILVCGAYQGKVKFI